MIKDDNVVATFANQKLKLDVRKTHRLFYQLALFFKWMTGLTSRTSFQETPRVSVTAIFDLIIFMYLSTVSFETGNIIKLLFPW